jgi:hypothetical protein
MLFRGPRIQGGVVGDDNYNPQDVTYELIGSVNLCEQILVGLRRVGTPGDLSGAAGNSAFNFIGNPYPAAINLKTIPAGDRTNIGANYYLWQPRTGVASGDVVFGIGAGRGGSYFPEPFWFRSCGKRPACYRYRVLCSCKCGLSYYTIH